MLENIRTVLVRPRGSGNIGSVARAMKNMGMNDLAIVGRARTKSFWARAMAVHAGDVLANTQIFTSLRGAIADCGLAVGTTCREGLYRSHSLPPRQVAPKITEAARSGKVALIFGPEDHGLSNQDLQHCQMLITIPASSEYASLNVAQAAMICFYEIFLASREESSGEQIVRAPAEAVEQLFDRMRRSLLNIGFLDPQNPDHLLLALRRILGRAGLEEKDVRIFSGLFRQLEWYANGGREIAEEKRKKGLQIR
jgi:tRNA/rRNA methyltransferase